MPTLGFFPMNYENVNGDYQYILIAGSTKSGTGSLYTYLGDHPDVCPSSIKETRFFFNPDSYFLPRSLTLESDGIDAYSKFFKHSSGQLFRLDATPDYLYSSGTAKIINLYLPSVKLIFILRNPIDRLISWYRFSKQQNLISSKTTFQEYVNAQFKLLQSSSEDARQQWMRSLKQGKYAHYLDQYLDVFSSDQMCITRFESMVSSTSDFLYSICKFCGLNEQFYDDYQFQIVNKTRTLKSTLSYGLYTRFRRIIRNRLHDKMVIRSFLRNLRKIFEPLYFKFAALPDEEIEISDELYARLGNLFADDQLRMEQIYSKYDCLRAGK